MDIKYICKKEMGTEKKNKNINKKTEKGLKMKDTIKSTFKYI